MGDVLSQNQIDDLLKSIAGGGSAPPPEKKEENKHKSYDFKSPKKFTKEDIKVIHDIFDVYSRLVSSYLTGETRLFCQAKVLAIEEQRYYEFSNALDDYTMMGEIGIIVKDDDIEDTVCMLQFSNSISLSIIDRLLGGVGNFIDISRDYTEIEIMIIKRIMVRMVAMLREAWADYVEVETTLAGIETNSRLNKVISADEIIVLVTLELEIASAKNIITLSIPAVSMGELMTKFSNKSRRVGKNYNPNKEMEIRRSLLNRVSQSHLNIKAILSTTTLDLGDLLLLQPNDVIPLDMEIHDNITITVNNNNWYEAKMGTSNSRKAVKLVGLKK